MENQSKEYRIVTMYTSQNVDTRFDSLEEASKGSQKVKGDFSIWEVVGEEVNVVFSTI